MAALPTRARAAMRSGVGTSGFFLSSAMTAAGAFGAEDRTGEGPAPSNQEPALAETAAARSRSLIA
ncbi:MAG: hypothetical protein M0D55_16475 [Elusimicrobiota bacterium]|nr:MAG: hypothetical protein M0D55_16475 [Elusimicrobiota bacterium]